MIGWLAVQWLGGVGGVGRRGEGSERAEIVYKLVDVGWCLVDIGCYRLMLIDA